MTKKIPTIEDFEAARRLYRRLVLKISFVEKRWLMDARSYEDYLRRLKELSEKHRVAVEE